MGCLTCKEWDQITKQFNQMAGTHPHIKSMGEVEYLARACLLTELSQGQKGKGIVLEFLSKAQNASMTGWAHFFSTRIRIAYPQVPSGSSGFSHRGLKQPLFSECYTAMYSTGLANIPTTVHSPLSPQPPYLHNDQSQFLASGMLKNWNGAYIHPRLHFVLTSSAKRQAKLMG